MGYIKHNALIIEICYGAPVWDVYNCIQRWVMENMGANLVSRPIQTAVNCDVFVFVAPDGSKQGWEADENGDKMRAGLYDFVTSKYPKSIEVLDVQFGGDDEYYELRWQNPWYDNVQIASGALRDE